MIGSYMNIFRRFFNLGVIVTLPLPSQIANGQPVDAVPVMADLNYLANQVNLNAQPITATPTLLEWQPLGQTPTYISATSFSVPGNLTAILPIGRRLQSTNTGGTVYSEVISSVFGAVTTVTVKNTSGVLDAGLSVVNYGLLNSVNTSSPVFTDFIAGTFNLTTLTPSSTVIIMQSVAALSDSLSEWSADVNARFTAKVAGDYLVRYDGFLLGNSANITLGMQFVANWYKNGVSQANTAVANWPFASGVSTNYYPFTMVTAVTLAVADYVDMRITTPAFTAANMQWQGNASYRRLSF